LLGRTAKLYQEPGLAQGDFLVYIRKIQIKNARGFHNVDLDLTRRQGSPAGWTVLAGRNGSGKSTLLRAIALAVAGPDTTRTLCGSFVDWIRVGQKVAEVRVRLEPSRGDGFEEFDIDPASLTGWARLHWKSAGKGLEPALSSSLSGKLKLLQENLMEGPWSSNTTGGWFLCGYGPYRRLSGHAADAQRLMEGRGRIARLVSLFREDSSLVECVGWLREIYLRRLEKKPGAAELERSVLALLNDGLLPDGTKVEKVDSEGLWVRQQGIRLPLSQLSDGYRTTAALVMDIVRHLERCFGRLRIETANDAEGPYYRVLHEGVVLIDEVDLHLHVSWQKRFGFWLKRHFPNIQFIVTTHSPFICQAADPRGLIRLPAPGEDRPAEHISEELYNTVVNGSIDDAVLTELFGLETPYSKPAERLREEIARLEVKLQTGKATDKDRREFQDLRARLPQNLSADVEQALRKLAAKR
jgi:energy-coupling factor transporter ATP-binding protein EcfA2